MSIKCVRVCAFHTEFMCSFVGVGDEKRKRKQKINLRQSFLLQEAPYEWGGLIRRQEVKVTEPLW